MTILLEPVYVSNREDNGERVACLQSCQDRFDGRTVNYMQDCIVCLTIMYICIVV
jgi:hypothetical protein